MKNYLILAIAVLLLFSCSRRQQYKNTEIYVTVIKKIPTDGVIDIKNYIEFSDNRGGKSSLDVSLEKFTSIVNPGKKVKWKKGSESLQKVKVIEIKFKEVAGNVHILESENISQEPDEVERKVKEKLNDGDIEFYSLEIEIEDKKYIIDPKLKFHN